MRRFLTAFQLQQHRAKRGRDYVSRKKEHELDLDVDVHWITEIK